MQTQRPRRPLPFSPDDRLPKPTDRKPYRDAGPSRYDARMADLNQLAARLVKQATEPQPKESPAQRSGRKGGLKGGKARAERLTPEERSEAAKKAAAARWARTPQA
jgi:hypothetical protein